jgi:hypothetical protein
MPEVVICVDWKETSKRTITEAIKMGIDTALVKQEPAVVTPGHSKRAIDRLFTKTIAVGRPDSRPIYKWPQTWNTEFFDQPIRFQRIVSINANKFSCLSGELYSLRSKAYSSLNYLDLYGHGWDRRASDSFLKLMKELQIAVSASPLRLNVRCFVNLVRQPRNFLGASSGKLATLSKYKTTLVIENSMEYMSEKLIDAILAGTIPVYVGPPVELYGIPKEIVVASTPDLESIKRATKFALEMNYDNWKSTARLWINDPMVRESWDGAKCITRIFTAAVSSN